MDNLTPKTDDALDALIEFTCLEEDRKTGYYRTMWGKKTAHGLKLSIINKLKEFGMELVETEK